MGMIQELNSRFHKLSEQTNARQQQVLEELNATLKEQARGLKRNCDMVEDRVKGEDPRTVKFAELVQGGGEEVNSMKGCGEREDVASEGTTDTFEWVDFKRNGEF